MTAPRHPSGKPLAIFTPAFDTIVRLRIEQVEQRGHTLEKDVAHGPLALVRMARGAGLKVAAQFNEASTTNQQMVGDMLIGQPAYLSDHALAVAYARLAKSAALTIAAMDVLDVIRAARTSQENDHGLHP